MFTEPIIVENNGPVCTITINRPTKRNAIDKPTANALREAFELFEADENNHVAILTGAGENFCAGADLKAMNNPDLRNEIDDKGEGPGPMGPTRMSISKPVIAAISGYAVAGGLELALMCDLRVVDRSAIFGVFCRRFGVPLIDGGTVRLPRVIGQGRALDMILTGRPVHAEEALQIGLANRLVEDGQALNAATRLAKEIAAFPQECMKADLSSTYTQWDYSLRQALMREGAAGHPIVFKEAIFGARQFTEGVGRHGDFSHKIKEK